MHTKTYPQGLSYVTVQLTRRNATQLTKDQQMFFAGKLVEEQVLLRAQTHVTSDFVHLLWDVETINVGMTGSRRIEASQNWHCGTLTSSVVATKS